MKLQLKKYLTWDGFMLVFEAGFSLFLIGVVVAYILKTRDFSALPVLAIMLICCPYEVVTSVGLFES